MKKSVFVVIILLALTARSEVMWTIEDEPSKDARANEKVNAQPPPKKSTSGSSEQNENKQKKGKTSGAKLLERQNDAKQARGNLSTEFMTRNFSKLEMTQSSVIIPNQSLKSTLSNLKVGDQLNAKIAHSIIAFPDEKSPVIATVKSGPLEGAKLLGESKLEPNTKRIFISFNQIRFGGKVYSFKGDGLTSELQPGFVGEYHSRESTYFAGDFISSLVAAYFDGLVPRQTNVFGAQVEDTSVDSAFKKGLAGGAMASANRFKEKLKKVPEFSELMRPIDTDVLVTGKAIEI